MDPVQEIKSRLSIVEVVEKYVPLKKAGRNLKGLCPFHNDHNPSLIVSAEKGMAWCFSCQSGGDIFSFVQKTENVDFPEALKILADMAGVELVRSTSPHQATEKKETKLRLMELLEVSQEFFRENFEKLKSVQLKVAERKIAEEVIRKFGVGYARDNFHALEEYLAQKGFSRREMLEAGVVTTKDEKGKEVYDRFRKRITFPIRDIHGSIRGFGGRIVGSDDPKYLNSPDTVLYNKSHILYGLNFAKGAIKREDFCLLVEGYFDVLSCHNAGIENVVAASGVALSPAHVKLIQRFSNNFVFAFDADSAGREATRRAIGVAMTAGASVFILPLSTGKDPDEALRSDKEKFLQELANRIPFMDFVLEDIFTDKNMESLEDNRKILDEFFAYLTLIPKDFERDAYLKKLLAKKNLIKSSDSAAKILEQEIFRFEKKQAFHRSGVSAEEVSLPPQDTSKISSFSYLIGIVSAFPESLKEIQEIFLFDLAPSGLEKKIYKALREEYNATGFLDLQNVRSKFSETEAEKWNLFTLYAEEKNDLRPASARQEEVRKVVRKLNKAFIEEELQLITEKLKNTSKDRNEQKELSKKNIDLTRLLNKL